MANTSYTTITLLKARLSITDSAADTPLQNILNSAAAVVDQGTRNPPPGVEAFSVSASATRYYDDRLTTDGVIDIDDAQTVTALTRASQTVTSTYYTLYPYNKGWALTRAFCSWPRASPSPTSTSSPRPGAWRTTTPIATWASSR
jgi:hypothetical protein